MNEMIVFVNKIGEKVIIENQSDYYEIDEFEFNVAPNTTIDESILYIDEYGVPLWIDTEKAFKPLKFYCIKWYWNESNTEDGYDCEDVITEFKEIDYLNQ